MPKITVKRFRDESAAILEQMKARATALEDKPEVKQRRVRRANTDYDYFCKTYLPHYFTKPFDKPFDEWNKWRDVDSKPVFLLGAPDVGKSTYFEIADTLHALLFGRLKYGVIGCLTLEQADDRVDFIRLELEENERIKNDFKFTRGRVWESGNFVMVMNGQARRLRSISFKTRIFGMTERNQRPDFCRLSDVEDDKTILNPKICKRIKAWIIESLMPRFAEPYSFLYNGNYLSERMALVQLHKEKDDETGRKKYPGKTYTLMDGRGQCRFPHLWPKARIAKRRKALGNTSFERVYNFKGIDDTKAFKDEWFMWEPIQILIGVTLVKTMGIDPAPEPNRQLTNDEKAIVIVGWDNVKWHVLDSWLKVASVGEMIAAGFDKYDKWRPDMCGIYGPKVEDLYRLLFDAEAEKRGRPPLPIHWQNESRNKISKLAGTLANYHENGKVIYVSNSGHNYKIVDEAKIFPDGQMGGLDAELMAIEVGGIRQASKNLVIPLQKMGFRV